MKMNMNDKLALKKVLEALHAGEVFVYPTDTIYGFGGNALSEKTIQKVYELKKRPLSMPVSLLVRNIKMLEEYAHISEMTGKIIEHFLPGALTLVLPAGKKDLSPHFYSDGDFLGFRMPDHDFCRSMMKNVSGPVITTSVNISGSPELRTIGDIEKYFGQSVDLFIYDPLLESREISSGSTVIKIGKDDDISLLREGPISFSDIIEVKNL
jgi:L-threonylcarbamoyladenylate synthase